MERADSRAIKIQPFDGGNRQHSRLLLRIKWGLCRLADGSVLAFLIFCLVNTVVSRKINKFSRISSQHEKVGTVCAEYR